MTARTPDQAAQIEPLIQAGAALANIAFNLSQRAGQPITEAWASSMREGYKAWDALTRARLVDKTAGLQASKAARRELLARQVPAGFRLVAIEPTPETIERICAAVADADWPEGYGANSQKNRRRDARLAYAEMLAAAPTAAVAGEATQWSKPDRAPGEDGFTYG